jgi:hypothetical protein
VGAELKNGKKNKRIGIASKVKSVKKATNSIISWGLILILIYEIDAVRGVFKLFFMWLESMIKPLFSWFDIVAFIVKNYKYVEYAAIVAILVGLIINVFLKVLKSCNEGRNRRAKGDSVFENRLLKYIYGNYPGRCFLISGSWGTGKTYILNSFLKRYYSASNRSVYSISCFGLTTREEVVAVIDKAIEDSDDSFNAVAIKTISRVPVVGDILESLLKKRYGYNSIKKDSILVFDDFERISLRVNKITEQRRKREEHRIPGMSYQDKDAHVQSMQENTAAIYALESTMKTNTDKMDFDRFVAITGVINELIEKKNCKVIVICNTDILGERFVNAVFRSKLNNIEYRKGVLKENKESVAQSVAERIVLEDHQKNEEINKYIINDGIHILGELHKTDNLREYESLIEAFIITADVFPTRVVTKGLLESLLVSIVVANKKVMRDNIESKSARIRPGMNLGFVLSNRLFSKYRWIGGDLAFYWLDNREHPKEAERIANEWENYPYFELEQELIQENYEAIMQYEFAMVHLGFVLDHIIKYPLINVDWTKCFAKLLDDYNLNDGGEISRLLSDFEVSLSGKYNAFNEIAFDIIARKSNNRRSSKSGILQNEYNSYLDKKGLKEGGLY